MQQETVTMEQVINLNDIVSVVWKNNKREQMTTGRLFEVNSSYIYVDWSIDYESMTDVATIPLDKIRNIVIISNKKGERI